MRSFFLVYSIDGHYLAIGIILYFTYLQRTEPRLASRGHRIVVEEIPLAIVFENGVMCGPSYYRSKYHALIGERSVRIVAHCIAKQVGVACGIREIILPVVFVHPRRLEETMRVVGLQRIAVVVNHEDGAWSLSIAKAIFCQPDTTAWQSVFLAFRQVWSLKVDIVLLALELSAPESTEVHIHLSVGIVAEGTHVYAITARHRSWLWNERAGRIVCYGCSPMEHVVAVLQREVHHVFLHLLAIAHASSLLFSICRHLLDVLLHIAVPKLSSCPWNILLAKHTTMIGHGSSHWVAIYREYMIVLHNILVAIVVFYIRRLPVVAWIDINFSVEDVN